MSSDKLRCVISSACQMLMHTSANRMLEHLNTFSIDYFKKQQRQQQQRPTDEANATLTSDYHDDILQSTVKDEKLEHHVGNNYLKSSSCAPETIDQPLLIVLDEDDASLDDENSPVDVTVADANSQDDLSADEGQKTARSSTNSPTASQFLARPKSHLRSFSDSDFLRQPHQSRSSPALTDETLVHTVVLNSSFMRQTYPQPRNKLVARRKHLHTFSAALTMSTNGNSKAHPLDEHAPNLSAPDAILSRISFDNTSDVLTVSRMGSIFYCVEDLHGKVFTSLCTLDEFGRLLVQPEKVPIKQATLSEKIAIEKQLTPLKKGHEMRYRLLSINASDYLLKLKHLLLTNKSLDETDDKQQQRAKRMEQIIDELRSYKRTPTPVLLKDTVAHSPMASKRLSSDDDEDDDDEDGEHDDDEPRKRPKIVTKKQKPNETPPLAPTQFGIFIQCNGPVSCNIFSTNETVATTGNATETTTTTTTVAKIESDIPGKSASLKKQVESEAKQIYFEKLQQQYHNAPKVNPKSEQATRKPSMLTRTDSQSPPDCHPANRACPPSTVMNMPIKRRILNSYNSDTNDSCSTSAVHALTSSVRYAHRSKSLSFDPCQTYQHARRSSSSPPIIAQAKASSPSPQRSPTHPTGKSTTKSKAEPIDLTDESYSMPMIVNVEENVELAHQRHKLTLKKSVPPTKPKQSEPSPTPESEMRLPPTAPVRPAARESAPPAPARPVPTHHSMLAPYRPTPYPAYPQQEPYAYRDPPHANPPSTSVSQSYFNSTAMPNNGNHHSYPYAPSAQYPVMKKSKHSPTPNGYDMRPSSVAPLHQVSSPVTVGNHQSGFPSTVAMPIIRKPNCYQQLTLEQQASIKTQASPPMSAPCRLACCYPPQTMPPHHSAPPYPTEKSMHNERFVYRSYSTAQTSPMTFKRDVSPGSDVSSASMAMNRKQRRTDSMPPSAPYTPYRPSGKPYFAPPPPLPPSSTPTSSSSPWSSVSAASPTMNVKPAIRYPYPPPPASAPINGMIRKPDPYPPQPRRPIPIPPRAQMSTPIIAQNSSALISPPNTPHELTLPNIRTRSIDLQRAIAERGCCELDKLPKLVVRHTKTYANKSIDTMGQLFPTWFNEPDYRCVHCFRCDQVFTPQQFMTHVDDEQMQNEQPVTMTSIQLLTSEKLSEYKVGLWNQFCTNLTIYARNCSESLRAASREGRIGGFSTSRNI